MSAAEQWAGLLGRKASGSFTLKFERLGLEAQCRSLSAGEVEECLRMGGEKGLRYALYLSCDELRQAGESLKKQGALASAFDITERLSYGDVVAAGAAILGQSGTDTTAVSLEGGQQAVAGGGMALAERFLEGGFPETQAGGKIGLYPAAAESEAVTFAQKGTDPWELADRLWAAWGNR